MQPRTFLVGVTQPDEAGLEAYLLHTGQESFYEELKAWYEERGDREKGIVDPLCLVSFYAKLCYKSLVEGKNTNVNRIRSMEDNLIATIKSGHGSVFEHVWLNFVTTGCSRVFTHELVRHRVGTAFSQTSGRYVAIDKIDLVLPPELEDQDTAYPCPNPNCEEGYENGNQTVACPVCEGLCQVTVKSYVEGLRDGLEIGLKGLRNMIIKPDMPFAEKKRLTSAIRRLAPNGQDNEIGWSCNVRALRHMLEMRTSLAAEWEIRKVFNQVSDIVQARWPLMMYGVTHGESADGVTELKDLMI